MHQWKDDALEDFDARDLTLEGLTKKVYTAGSGPAVIVMAEMPGISPHVARFSRWVRDAGFTCAVQIGPGRGGDPLFGVGHEHVGHTCAPVPCADVHLLQFVVDDHDEAGDLSVDHRHGRVADPLCCPRAERVGVARGFELRRDVPEVTIAPTGVPDRCQRRGILRRCRAHGHTRVHQCDLLSMLSRLDVPGRGD